jgi:hypothetical protein
VKPFRIKCKVYERVVGGEMRQFIAATATLDLRTGDCTAMLLSDGLTISQEMTIDEWNALPFVYFETDGSEAPRPPTKVLPQHWDRSGKFTKGRD